MFLIKLLYENLKAIESHEIMCDLMRSCNDSGDIRYHGNEAT